VAKWLIGSGCRLARVWGGEWGRSRDGCIYQMGVEIIEKEGAVLG